MQKLPPLDQLVSLFQTISRSPEPLNLTALMNATSRDKKTIIAYRNALKRAGVIKLKKERQNATVHSLTSSGQSLAQFNNHAKGLLDAIAKFRVGVMEKYLLNSNTDNLNHKLTTRGWQPDERAHYEIMVETVSEFYARLVSFSLPIVAAEYFKILEKEGRNEILKTILNHMMVDLFSVFSKYGKGLQVSGPSLTNAIMDHAISELDGLVLDPLLRDGDDYKAILRDRFLKPELQQVLLALVPHLSHSPYTITMLEKAAIYWHNDNRVAIETVNKFADSLTPMIASFKSLDVSKIESILDNDEDVSSRLYWYTDEGHPYAKRLFDIRYGEELDEAVTLGHLPEPEADTMKLPEVLDRLGIPRPKASAERLKKNQEKRERFARAFANYVKRYRPEVVEIIKSSGS